MLVSDLRVALLVTNGFEHAREVVGEWLEDQCRQHSSLGERTFTELERAKEGTSALG
jgi:hypothetical protein